MKCFLEIPYNYSFIEDKDFDYNGEIDYINDLSNAKSNILGYESYFDNVDNSNEKNYKFNQQNHNNINQEDVINYYDIPCNILTEEYQEVDIEYLLNFYKTKESFLLTLIIDENSIDYEEGIIEFKSWVVESLKINNLDEKHYSEEIKMNMLPRRNFIIKTDKNRFELNTSMFIEKEENKIIIFVKEIIFYK